jgi:glycosyltransferase involved in cell wall biosynthesis
MIPAFSLITFASYWGSQYGGINAFNADFLEAMGIAYEGKVNVICVVNSATDKDIEDAKGKQVRLVPLPYKPLDSHMGQAQALAAINELGKQDITFNPTSTIWLGHDRITGEAALAAAKQAGGRAALIHHMSYDHYEAFAENAVTANDKRNQQEALFNDADILMAVGPLLRDALEDMVDGEVNMIIPGLAAIEPKKKQPNTFSMFVSGRLSKDASKIKQGQLAVAAFADCYKQAKQQGHPEAILKRPKLLMRGVNFDLTAQDSDHYSTSEENLQKFAEGYADAVINLQPLPYTTDREQLFKDLKSASVAAMPSWHEGFGLVGWEAIAAGVPLILSKDSGVYELIEQNHSGFEQSHVWAVAIDGKTDDPYFSDNDLTAVSEVIKQIGQNPSKAREKAERLRLELLGYTWDKCAEEVAGFFDWDISKGLIGEVKVKIGSEKIPAASETVEEIAGYEMPKATFDNNQGSAISVLLRASEAVVPFDVLRQPELDKLLQWSTTTPYPISIRLIKGEGGLGKTRLATELCHQLKAQDWTVGLLDKDQPQPKLAKLWQYLQARLQVTGKPCLLVVDYAETQTTELINLLKLMLSNKSNESSEKVCLLLLARDGGEWWQQLASKDALTEGLLAGRATTGPYPVSPLYDSAEQRQQGYQSALKAFAAVLRLDAPTTIPDLAGEHFAKPLYIQMAALLMLHGEQPKSADGITRAILNHEQRYWDAALNGADVAVGGLTARKLLALVTLAGHFATAKDAKSYWDIADDGSLSALEFRQLFDCLAPLYPAMQGLQAVKPDLLGEALVAEMLEKPAGARLLSAVFGQSASSKVKLNALTVLARLSLSKLALDPVIIAAFVQYLAGIGHELVAVAVETDSRLVDLAVTAIGQLKTNEQNAVAGQLVGLLLDDSVALNFLTCEVRRIIYEKEQKKFDKKPKAIKVQASYADALYNYALGLYYIGNDSEACIKGKQAVDLRRQLASQDPIQYEPDYASSLNNYANRLYNIGQNDQALITAKKAMRSNNRWILLIY